MSFVIIILSIFVVSYLVKLYYKWYLFDQRLKNIAGPKPLPFIGNLLLIKSQSHVITVGFQLQKQFKGLVKIYLGFIPRIIIYDQKYAEFLLNSTTILEKSYEYNFLKPWLGTGLLTSSGSKWKIRRKLITPTFHFQILEQYIGIFNVQSDVLVDCLKDRLDEQAFDLFPYITLCTLDVICEAAMGTQVNAQKDSNNIYVRSVKDMCIIVAERVFSPTKMINFLYQLTTTYSKEKKTLSVLHNYTTSVINERRQSLNAATNIETDEDTGIKRRLTFLDLLLRCNLNGSKLSTESIREEVDTFMFEGHDTTASGVAFTLYCLSKNKNKHIQAKLHEIFCDDKNRSPTYQDLQSMKYLEMVIKEALRLYPPVPTYSRTLNEDVEFDNHILPKGLTLTILALSLHRQEEVFPDPEKFDPERFSLENSSKRSPYAYLPFSAGARNCIGQRFAMLELKSVVSKFNYNLNMSSNTSKPPKIWKEFERKRHSDGKLIKFWLQEIEEHQIEDVVELLLKNYIYEEPLSKYFKVAEDELTLAEGREFYKHCMLQGYSIVCMTKDDDDNPKIVGFNINTLDSKYGPKIEVDGIAFNQMLAIVEYIHSINNMYEYCGVAEFFCDKGLYVLPEYRGYGITVEYLHCWKLIAKENNIKVVGGTFTSKFSQAAAQKAGFTELVSRAYVELRKIDHELVPDNIEEHTENLKVYYSEV
ncbi:hypothetical protein RN001_008406 [Aquatica leii]|uniref:Cytochrome P450 n=1 Tax=Aquatica leii TaxID=1421715 RepID=A0AAN7SRC2_9COLE|nr:hypothetical protein RN001_008406 [Aquatica leii]